MSRFTVGLTNPNTVWLVSQVQPFVRSEYLAVEDPRHGRIILEVMQTVSLGVLTDANLPEGVSMGDIQKLQLSPLATTFFAQARVLDSLLEPITPHVMVVPATFEEVSPFLNSVDPTRSFVLGVLQGTKPFTHLLPTQLQGIAPTFKQRQIQAQEGIPFLFDFYKFTDMPNIGVFGGAGSGKSTALRSICEEVMRFRIPSLLLDPHHEFSFDEKLMGMPAQLQQDFSKSHVILTVGKEIGIKFSDLSTSELLGLFQFYDISKVMESAIRAIHEPGDDVKYFEWKLATLKKGFENDKKHPNERENVFEGDDAGAILYYRLKDKVSGFETLQAVMWRFDQLASTRIFNQDIQRIEDALMARQLVVIRGDAFKTDLLAAYAIRKLYYKRRAFEDQAVGNEAFFPGFLVMMDEAHRYAPKSFGSNPTRDLLVELSREGRKYGVYIVAATQRAASLDETLTAQLNTKFIFRTTNAQDMEVFRAEANLTDEMLRTLPVLASGQCYASSSMFSKNFAVQFKAPLTVAPKSINPFDQLPPLFATTPVSDAIQAYFEQTRQVFRDHERPRLQAYVGQALNRLVTLQEIDQALEVLTQIGVLRKKEFGLGTEYFLAH